MISGVMVQIDHCCHDDTTSKYPLYFRKFLFIDRK
jgi:hypothetical protein